MDIQLVWLKRDLRLDDHPALYGALERGPVVGLFVFEDGLLGHADTDSSHVQFVAEGLLELRRAWAERGGILLVRRGEMVETLEALWRGLGFSDLWSHQETGNLWTYDRDLRVSAWCRERGIARHEPWQNGVVRRLKSRDGWAGYWNRRMTAPALPAPETIRAPDIALPEPGAIPTLAQLGLPPSARTEVQAAGELAAQETLASFLAQRSVQYRSDMSSPVTGWAGCSRLSTYLAWGNLSVRRVFQASQDRARELKEARARGEEVPASWLPSLSSFRSRLRWHCHFMQKLEDQPDLETEEMNRAYKGLRDALRDPAKLEAFAEGRTGYPMVDACMRCLHQTGWINFRMRAMLVSFGTHHLSQPWQDIGGILAPLFLDFEPGIHYSQTQMQAGVTGINTVRIYSPAKQVADQDPDGVFLKRWLPELEGVSKEYLPVPHEMPHLVQIAANCHIGRDYPPPIVEHKSAYAAARKRILEVRKTEAAKLEAKRVYRKHGSRRRPTRRRS
ncbi:MAG: FAD-binding domain-containing protein [Acidobacteriota bacterium]